VLLTSRIAIRAERLWKKGQRAWPVGNARVAWVTIGSAIAGAFRSSQDARRADRAAIDRVPQARCGASGFSTIP
jgi:hypothetical protein